ncbi:zinc finger, CCHC-type containing protein [Tanacetum coccineum]
MMSACAGVDTITLNQTIKDGDTIVSSSENFEMGFFSPGTSKNRYIGIWYKKISTCTVVWVANRETPLTNKSGVLKVGHNGLELLNGTKTVIWSTHTSEIVTTSGLVVQILDSGNLVLQDQGNSIWQSFDYPGDTLLSGMSIRVDLLTRKDIHLTSWKNEYDPSAGPYVLRVEPYGDMTKDKDSGDTSKKELSTTNTPQFQCPLLKPSNYSLWAIRMQIILEANGLWEMIEPNDKTVEDNRKDKTAIAFLYQALPEEQLLQITKHKTAKEIWTALKTKHVGEERVQQARLQTLKSEFELLHMKEDETIDTFTAKLTTLANKAAGLGHTFDDSTLVRKLLNAVPDRYLQIVASIEQYSDLGEMSLEEAIGRLKAYEERIKFKKGKQVNDQEKLMFTRHDNRGKNFRGRGRGKYKFSHNNNHEKFREEKKNGDTSSKKDDKNNFRKSRADHSKLTCYQCNKIGHIAPNCQQRTKTHERSNLVEEELEPTLLMAILDNESDVVDQKSLATREDVGYKSRIG